MEGEITLSESDRNVRIEWTISNFFEKKKAISSPMFDIFNHRCDLNIDPENEGSVCMYLFIYTGSEINSECIMGMKMSDGSETRTEKTEFVLGDGCVTDILELIAVEDLLRSKDILAPDDYLTVFCNIHLTEAISDPVVNILSPPLKGMKREGTADELSTNTSFQEKKGFATSGDSAANEYFSDLSVKFKDLYLKKRFTDVIIKVRNKEFCAHKLILIARSEVFASMFERGSSERRSSIVKITDCDPDSFEDFLLFLYTADVTIVSSRNVVELYKTSDKYRCKELLKVCVRCMVQELSTDTFFDYFPIATMYIEFDLLGAVINFFIKNAKKILTTTKWLTLLEEHPSVCNELIKKFANAAQCDCRK